MKKIIVKEILIDKYNDFKNKYWYRVPEIMSEHVYDLADKVIKCSDINNGLMLEINIEKSVIGEVMKVLSLRYVMAAIFACIFIFALRFEAEMKKALAVVAFAPISIIGPTFTEKAGGSAIQASLGVSISILCSVIIMTIMVIDLGVA